MTETHPVIRTAEDRISIWVPGPPPTQGSMRSYGLGRITHDNSKKITAWRADVRQAVAALTPEELAPLPLVGPLELGVMAYLHRPAKHYRANGNLRATAPGFPTTRPDLDKIVRAIGDALTLANAWLDDSQVTRVLAIKAYALHPMEEGTEILIRRARPNPPTLETDAHQ